MQKRYCPPMHLFAMYMSILRHDNDLERTMQQLGVNKTDNDVNKLMRQQIIERKVFVLICTFVCSIDPLGIRREMVTRGQRSTGYSTTRISRLANPC